MPRQPVALSSWVKTDSRASSSPFRSSTFRRSTADLRKGGAVSVAEEHLRLWLRAGMTGCEFAKHLAGKAGRVAVALYNKAEHPPTGWLSNVFDEHAKAERAVIVVLPRIASELALVD